MLNSVQVSKIQAVERRFYSAKCRVAEKSQSHQHRRGRLDGEHTRVDRHANCHMETEGRGRQILPCPTRFRTFSCLKLGRSDRLANYSWGNHKVSTVFNQRSKVNLVFLAAMIPDEDKERLAKCAHCRPR